LSWISASLFDETGTRSISEGFPNRLDDKVSIAVESQNTESVVFYDLLCHNPALAPPGSSRAAVAAQKAQSEHRSLAEHPRRARADRRGPAGNKESQMPKIKTKSGAKKRFKVTGTGKVLYQQSRKRHGMIKRTKKQIRQLRGTNVLFKTDGDNVKKYWLPNG
jgi:large subunit ribosomal protein L35